jgi:hypothetical protein
MINEIERFPAIPPGTDEGITLTPPLNFLAIDAAAELTYGGTAACSLVSYGMKQSNSLVLYWGSLNTRTSTLSISVVLDICEGSLKFNERVTVFDLESFESI